MSVTCSNAKTCNYGWCYHAKPHTLENVCHCYCHSASKDVNCYDLEKVKQMKIRKQKIELLHDKILDS